LLLYRGYRLRKGPASISSVVFGSRITDAGAASDANV